MISRWRVGGGLVTAGAGLIAERYGPEVGGLFLAYPAIFPAGATLIEKHEKERKRKARLNGTRRARLDATGAALRAIGLLVFALVVSQYLQTHETILLLATPSRGSLDRNLNIGNDIRITALLIARIHGRRGIAVGRTVDYECVSVDCARIQDGVDL